ncbi:hypothetical protein [Nocardioides sp. YIM 152588]|uniref:hypothetical protein n=1 Tax=Nocardioides sp. YIM 152588 TaxID=3158259 RepID=UPI0032E48C37
MVMHDERPATDDTAGAGTTREAGGRRWPARIGWTAAAIATGSALGLSVVLGVRLDELAGLPESAPVAPAPAPAPAPVAADPADWAEPAGEELALADTGSMAIPADFPLNLGQTAVDPESGEEFVPTPGRDLDVVRPDLLCGMPIGAPAPADHLVSVGRDFEWVDARELVLFADAAEASAYLDGLRSAVADCRVDRRPGGAVRLTEHQYSTGYDDLYFSETATAGVGGGAYQLLRVGAAVLVRYTGGDMGAPAEEEYLAYLAEQNRPIALRMCLFTAAGCN